MSEDGVRVTGLFYYPVKSCRGSALDVATLDRRGIVDDRRMMIVDASGRFITQRSHPRLALVDVQLGGGELTLRAPELSPVTIPVVTEGPTRPVLVWRDECLAIDQGEDISRWLSAFVGEPVALVRIDDAFIRPVDPMYAVKASNEVGFADAYPLLLISDESLADLNARLEQPVLMNRFRPNIVVRGASPYAEDRWRRVRIGDVTMAIVKPCARCCTVTVDQTTGIRGKEPLRTLAGYRHDPEFDVLFGQNAIHAAAGTIRVGDSVSKAN